MCLYRFTLETPCGGLWGIWGPRGLRVLRWTGGGETPSDRGSLDPAGGDLREGTDPGGVVTALRRYFEGDLGVLAGIPVQPEGTAFQRLAWQTLRRIPPGVTWTYGEQARAMGRESAARAVGAANGANPVPVVIPCHRVVSATGGLGGYSSGVERKRWLLRHEGAWLEEGG